MPLTALWCSSALTRLASARSARLRVLSFSNTSFWADVLVVDLLPLAPDIP
jgi:hypothetical protein